MNMQIATVAALFAVLTAIPQTVLGQSQFNSISSNTIPSNSFAAAPQQPQYEPYNPAYYNGFQAPEQYYQNGISAQDPAANFQGYYPSTENFQNQYAAYPAYDGQYGGASYADSGAYPSALPYPYQYQPQEQLQQQV
ncbi:uncharacterized protein LOC135835143 [Planococcus citri]|uniref:uncharacterized protein LOC135835143 n=1 Tax=Planococcus citri TaxID=170843 RepID=UPI0031F97146